jgi:pimeloyl-ACP methyl ester carboxylesterase
MAEQWRPGRKRQRASYPHAGETADYFRRQAEEEYGIMVDAGCAKDVSSNTATATATLNAPIVDVIGESFGTVAMAFISSHHPGLMRRTVYVDPVNLYPSFGQLIRFGADKALESFESAWAASPYFLRFVGAWFIRGDPHAQFALKRAITVVEFFEKGELDRSDALFLIGGKDLAISPPHALWYLQTRCPKATVSLLNSVFPPQPSASE